MNLNHTDELKTNIIVNTLKFIDQKFEDGLIPEEMTAYFDFIKTLTYNFIHGESFIVSEIQNEFESSKSFLFDFIEKLLDKFIKF